MTHAAARRRLQAHLAKWGNGTRLAEELGVSRQAVANWANGEDRPKAPKIFALEKILGVPPEAWSQGK